MCNNNRIPCCWVLSEAVAFAAGVLTITLPEGSYEIEEGWYLKETYSGQEYRLGDEIEVICARADVNLGKVDLGLA